MLGLGTTPPTWNEDWHGLTLTKPVTRMREYIECIRTMWTGSPVQPVSYSGGFYRVRDDRRFMPAPAAQPPIYLAGTLIGVVLDASARTRRRARV